MNRRPFKLTVSDSHLRTLNRKEYYKTMRWLRSCARNLHEQMVHDKVYDKIDKGFRDVMLYGYSEIVI